jgi:hypothetical protein
MKPRSYMAGNSNVSNVVIFTQTALEWLDTFKSYTFCPNVIIEKRGKNYRKIWKKN